LYLPGRGSRSALAERRTSGHIISWQTKVHVVEDVKELKPELELLVFADLESLYQRKVEVYDTRSSLSGAA
jgi:hypothetical protein